MTDTERKLFNARTAEVERLRAANAELLAACEAFLEASEGPALEVLVSLSGLSGLSGVLANARALIGGAVAKARGTP